MNRSVWALVWLASGFLFASQRTGSAAVFELDWKTPDDGLLTYDDVNQREWLDLTESRLALFPGSTFEQRYQAFLPELAPGGRFEGFGVAKANDLWALASSAGISQSKDDFSQNHAPTNRLISLIGESLTIPTRQIIQAYGLLDDGVVIGQAVLRRIGFLSTNPGSGPNGQAGLDFTIPIDSIRPENTGVWMFRSIPEPHSIALGMIGVVGMRGRKRCHESF